MIDFAGRGILLDIEGTTSSIAFVYDVLFPFARQHLHPYLESHWEDAETQKAAVQIARDAGASSLPVFAGDDPPAARAKVEAEVIRLMDGDVKATGLKQLQGLIWKDGFESGEIKAHVYPDVPPSMKNWHQAGIDVRIYSSGSIAAQKLFFAHTEAGDLLPFLNGHYDTTTGPKRAPGSYVQITKAFDADADDILFISDVIEELDAAQEAGMATTLSVRPGNPPVTGQHEHLVITSFADIRIAG